MSRIYKRSLNSESAANAFTDVRTGIRPMMIRAYCKSDIEAVVRLFTDSVHDLGGGHYDANQRTAWAPRPPDFDRWRVRLASVKTLVAETDSELIGFLSYELNGHIDLLYTSPQCCRRGVASALYRETEAILICNGVSEFFTEASMVARPAFERWGFHVTEEQRVELRGIAFLRYAMRKTLSPAECLQPTVRRRLTR